MIINIRGTGGSGKSTIVREVMKRYEKKVPIFVPRRVKPLCYHLIAPNMRDLAVLGHYEIACGGCDTISKVGDVFELVQEKARLYYDVIFEGIISQDDVTRTTEINRQYPITVLNLTTPIDVCLKSIQDRRDARGDDRPLSKTNTVARAERLKRNIARLKDNGVEVINVTRESAVGIALKKLGWTADEREDFVPSVRSGSGA
jgi:hypothetical protein